jgi:hypothetical protein
MVKTCPACERAYDVLELASHIYASHRLGPGCWCGCGSSFQEFREHVMTTDLAACYLLVQLGIEPEFFYGPGLDRYRGDVG